MYIYAPAVSEDSEDCGMTSQAHLRHIIQVGVIIWMTLRGDELDNKVDFIATETLERERVLFSGSCRPCLLISKESCYSMIPHELVNYVNWWWCCRWWCWWCEARRPLDSISLDSIVRHWQTFVSFDGDDACVKFSFQWEALERIKASYWQAS